MQVPGNLTLLALDDYERVLTESLAWGVAHSTKLRNVLLKHFAEIENGVALGRKRSDLPFKSETYSIRVGRTPYLIFYRPSAGLVVRIIHGKRDLPEIFDSGLR